MKLNEIVQDWGGFEELIKDIHEGENVSVQHNVTLIGQSQASRQIDVLIEHSQGPYTYKTLVECKYWKKKVERANIDVLYAGMQDLNASKGVFFTTEGYQAGAETYAKSKNISIFIVKEVSDEEWGSPGKFIDFYLQVIQKAIYKVEPKETQAIFLNGSEEKINLQLCVGDVTEDEQHLIISEHKNKFRTLENLIEFYAEDALSRYQNSPLLINSGEECLRYLRFPLNLDFVEPLQILKDETIIFIPKISLEVSLKIDQSKITIDRSVNYLYALSVVDYLNDQNFLVSKLKEAEYPEWQTVKRSNTAGEQLLRNGSILTVGMKGYFDIKETDHLKLI